MNNIRKLIHHPLLAVFLIDIVAVCILAVAFALIGETILPGIIYRYISPLTLWAALFILCTAATLVARAQNVSYGTNKKHAFFAACAFVFFITLVGIASLHYGMMVAGIMVFFVGMLFLVFYKIYREKLQS